jgi:hypothetical protein
MSVIGGVWYAKSGGQFNNYPVDPDAKRFVYSDMPNGEKFLVAKVYSDGEGDYDSTAHLLAAAPDLLAACEELLIYLGDWDDMENDTCAAVRKAIAKAKGESL